MKKFNIRVLYKGNTIENFENIEVERELNACEIVKTQMKKLHPRKKNWGMAITSIK